jgi:hypothetical protein
MLMFLVLRLHLNIQIISDESNSIGWLDLCIFKLTTNNEP